jgi:tryptophan-rich sensory protein
MAVQNRISEEGMLELYHNINSVCAQKVRSAIFDRMQDPDWAPFENLAPDPWPKVQTLLQAA